MFTVTKYYALNIYCSTKNKGRLEWPGNWFLLNIQFFTVTLLCCDDIYSTSCKIILSINWKKNNIKNTNFENSYFPKTIVNDFLIYCKVVDDFEKVNNKKMSADILNINNYCLGSRGSPRGVRGQGAPLELCSRKDITKQSPRIISLICMFK